MKEKRVVSISLGSSKRNHKAQIELFGYQIHIERIGVDGDKERFKKLLSELDGKVDVFGLGGADLCLRAGKYRYKVVDVATLVSGLKKTPIVDGGELKAVWEREIPRYLVEQEGFSLAGKRALVMSGMDRYGLAEGLKEVGCQILIGDMPFALGIPIALRSLWTLRFLSVLMMPVLRRLPIEVLYPTGKKQEKSQPKFQKYFERSDIIAGDFLYIFRFAPENLFGKMLITNTVTSEDVTIMRQRGVEVLVTTTPEMNGRSFGTNVLQAIFVTVLGKRPELIEPNEYLELMRKLDIRPRVLRLQEV
ncbi:MAG: quinate 5-dehydrogenase [Candidatus Caldatribacteriaceae bacterium]